MENVINLYKQFPKYRMNGNKDLYNHIIESINHNQYKTFEDDKGLFAFVNWALLNKENEDHYKKTGMIKKDTWKSGDRLWLCDILICNNPRKVMSWVYNYFKDFLKTNESINWLRVDANNKIYRISKKYKREFHI
jgi:hemolysin-activating ACP:hemolysin acyltransferase